MPTHPHKRRRYLQWLAVVAIMVVAIVFRFQHIKSIPPGLYPDEAMNGNNAIHALEMGEYKVFYPENNGREGLFINLQAQSIRLFGNEPWTLRIVSAIFGTLTVLGLFLLARRLFNWQIAAFAGFLLATSFWHTLFSRIGFRAIMVPFLFTWVLYFFWRGKSTARLWNFAVSGILLGLGFYTYIAYRILPLVIILTLIAYWRAVRKDFSHEKYIHIRNQMTRGFALLMVSAIIVALPIGWYFYQNPADFMGRTAQVSVFNSDAPLQTFIVNGIKTLGQFNFMGDWNWRHNFAGRPLLFWPVGVLFVVGFLRSIMKLVRTKRHRGHLPTVEVLTLSWFFLGLAPVMVSSEGIPHALRSIVVAPVVFIFAGEGLWWLYEVMRREYHARDTHDVAVHGYNEPESNVAATFAVLLLLAAILMSEYQMYFKRWAQHSDVPPNYNAEYATLGRELNALPQTLKKYVVVYAGGVLVNGIPMPAQTVMFITDTWTPEKQRAKNIYYLTEEEYRAGRYEKRNSKVFPLR